MDTEQNNAGGLELLLPSPEGQRKFELTPRGLRFFEPMGVEECAQLLRSLKMLGDHFELCFGSAVKATMAWHGEEHTKEILAQLELPLAAARRALALAQAELPFDTWTGLTAEHLVILSVEFKGHELQERWAQRVVDHELSPRALKRSIERGEVVTDSEMDEDSGKKSGGLGFLDELDWAFESWARRIGGRTAVLDLPVEDQEHWMKGVKKIVDLYHEVETRVASAKGAVEV
jgi:hypothetical protein